MSNANIHAKDLKTSYRLYWLDCKYRKVQIVCRRALRELRTRRALCEIMVIHSLFPFNHCRTDLQLLHDTIENHLGNILYRLLTL